MKYFIRATVTGSLIAGLVTACDSLNSVPATSPSPSPSPIVEQYMTPIIPVETAMKLIQVETEPSSGPPQMVRSAPGSHRVGGARGLYDNLCARCHGEQGRGGIRVRNIGVFPKAFVEARPFRQVLETLRNEERFISVVTRGIPGDFMPGNANISKTDLQELRKYLLVLAAEKTEGAAR